ncbi:MAG: hypothetical protein JWQ10_3281 [Herbaspirillum sp.]|jgi:hypothetical protein|nr:hypothetical protein [Herbaspirillum sp.]
MKSSIPQTNYFRPSARKLAMALALVFASLIGGFSISPALARDDGHDRGGRYGDHGDRGNHGDRGDRGRPEYRRGYRYERPVYVPPPVYYEPRQSPGINLFIPLDLRR